VERDFGLASPLRFAADPKRLTLAVRQRHPGTVTRPRTAGNRREIQMKRTMLGGKIHRATVTDACLDYEGSITVDGDLLDAAGILDNEAVQVWNVTNGMRVTTYALSGPRGSGVVCVNGAAAHYVHSGDLVIIASFVSLEDADARAWHPRVVLVDASNRITDRRHERLPV
jgi:aspartate 1-decarboxylase